MLRNSPLFKGDCEISQLFSIFQVLGKSFSKIEYEKENLFFLKAHRMKLYGLVLHYYLIITVIFHNGNQQHHLVNMFI